jgi:hypothetical protein
MFREYVIGFFGGGDKEKNIVDSYCETCRAAKKNLDCSKCSKDIKVFDINTARNKKHGK